MDPGYSAVADTDSGFCLRNSLAIGKGPVTLDK